MASWPRRLTSATSKSNARGSKRNACSVRAQFPPRDAQYERAKAKLFRVTHSGFGVVGAKRPHFNVPYKADLHKNSERLSPQKDFSDLQPQPLVPRQCRLGRAGGIVMTLARRQSLAWRSAPP